MGHREAIESRIAGYETERHISIVRAGQLAVENSARVLETTQNPDDFRQLGIKFSWWATKHDLPDDFDNTWEETQITQSVKNYILGRKRFEVKTIKGHRGWMLPISPEVNPGHVPDTITKPSKKLKINTKGLLGYGLRDDAFL